MSGSFHPKKLAYTERREPSTTSYTRKINEEERRETSTTAAILKTPSQADHTRQQISREVDLDDESEEYISNIL
jgi:hypothetical protein